MEWYIKKIRDTEPELLRYNADWLRDWIDNTIVEQESMDAANRLDDVIKDAEDYYGVEVDYMSKLQLLSVIAKMLEVLGVI